MKRTALLGILALAFAVPSAFAQNHGEVGAFAELFRLNTANPAINFVGLGDGSASTFTTTFNWKPRWGTTLNATLAARSRTE